MAANRVQQVRFRRIGGHHTSPRVGRNLPRQGHRRGRKQEGRSFWGSRGARSRRDPFRQKLRIHVSRGHDSLGGSSAWKTGPSPSTQPSPKPKNSPNSNEFRGPRRAESVLAGTSGQRRVEDSSILMLVLFGHEPGPSPPPRWAISIGVGGGNGCRGLWKPSMSSWLREPVAEAGDLQEPWKSSERPQHHE